MGIPSRVCGGWQVGDGFRMNHLWTEIYLSPYGWVPVDVEEARCQINSGGYRAEERAEIKKYFFGVFDHFHLCFHNHINLPLAPFKNSRRSFQYAFHLAEKEYDGENITFDKSYFEIEYKSEKL